MKTNKAHNNQPSTTTRTINLTSLQVHVDNPDHLGKLKVPTKRERRLSKKAKSQWISPRFPPSKSSWVNAHKHRQSFAIVASPPQQVPEQEDYDEKLSMLRGYYQSLENGRRKPLLIKRQANTLYTRIVRNLDDLANNSKEQKQPFMFTRSSASVNFQNQHLQLLPRGQLTESLNLLRTSRVSDACRSGSIC